MNNQSQARQARTLLKGFSISQIYTMDFLSNISDAISTYDLQTVCNVQNWSLLREKLSELPYENGICNFDSLTSSQQDCYIEMFFDYYLAISSYFKSDANIYNTVSGN